MFSSVRHPHQHPFWLSGVFLSLGLCSLNACGDTNAALRARYDKAKAVFVERCKKAGVVIKRTVKEVEGIELVKIRQPIPFGGREYFDPMYPEAAMAGERRGDDYIKQFLMSEFLDDRLPNRRGGFGPPTKGDRDTHSISRRGYKFVEYVDPLNGNRMRCVPDWSLNHPNWVPGQHRCDKVESPRTRYALDYEDLVDPADRELWIAGVRLKVIDKQTGDVIAELTQFVWDSGFGVSTTGRWPWQYAGTAASTMCPSDSTRRTGFETRYFIDTILQPTQD